jgi:hypothetical protein
MKRSLLAVWLFIASAGFTIAQVTGVSTSPQNKIAILEEFTGVRCPNCPPGHAIISQLLIDYPGQFYVVAYHPNNSSYTPPYSGDEDFQRAYPAAFYSTPYCGSSRFMPSAFINRREWSTGEKITSRSAWANSATSIMGEASPMNVGVVANYDDGTDMLTVTVEVYYTSQVADQNALYVTLAENDLVTSQQSGASGPYTHKHTFREALTAQWGDDIADRSVGLRTFTYTYDNSVTQYNMNNCEVMAFVENKTNEELYTGWGNNVQMGGVATVDPAEFGMKVYPNPFTQEAAVIFQTASPTDVSYQIINIQGSTLAERNLGSLNPGSHRIDINAAELGLAPGLYFIQLTAGEDSAIQRIVVQ